MEPVDYAVLGVGALAEAIVVGLCEGVAEPPSIALSPRSAERSGRLAERFATVRIAADNQELVSAGRVVIVCLRPQDAPEVLPGLRFRADQSVVSVMAMVTMDQLAELVAPATDLARAVPVPAVADREPVTPVHPPTEAATQLFDALGGHAPISTDAQLDDLFIASATVAAFYSYLGAVSGWLADRGQDPAAATRHVAGLFATLAPELQAGPTDFADLAAAHTTRGGLNEAFDEALREAGLFAAIGPALDNIWHRIHGATR